jgi:hypothetical protein
MPRKKQKYSVRKVKGRWVKMDMSGKRPRIISNTKKKPSK